LLKWTRYCNLRILVVVILRFKFSRCATGCGLTLKTHNTSTLNIRPAPIFFFQYSCKFFSYESRIASIHASRMILDAALAYPRAFKLRQCPSVSLYQPLQQYAIGWQWKAVRKLKMTISAIVMAIVAQMR
jgi:hypothetical protein